MRGTGARSFSRITQYRSCSLAYRFKYVEKVPPAFTPGALAFGVAWHAGAAVALDGLLAGGFPPVENLVTEFSRSLDGFEIEVPIRWGEKLDRESAINQARAMYVAWISWERPASRIIAVEEAFEVELAAWLPRITGRVDLIEEAENYIVISDLKTSRSRWSQADADSHADQLVIYRHAFKHLAQELKKPIVAAFKVVTKTKSPTMERFLVEETAGSIDRQVKIASVMVEGVEREVFLPSPSWAYSTCPWAGLRQPEHLLTCSGVFHVSVGGALPGVVTGQISNIIGGLLPSLLSWKARTARPAILVTLPINSLSARNNALFDSYI